MFGTYNRKMTLALVTLLLLGLAVAVQAAKVRYTYDRGGRLTDVDYPDGTYIHYVYDRASNITRVHKVGAASVISGDVFADNRITLKDAIVSLQVAGGLSVEGIHLRGDINGDGRIDAVEAVHLLHLLSQSGP